MVQKTSAMAAVVDAAPKALRRELLHACDKFVKWTSEVRPASLLMCCIGTYLGHCSQDRKTQLTLYSSSTQSGRALRVVSSSSICSGKDLS